MASERIPALAIVSEARHPLNQEVRPIATSTTAAVRNSSALLIGSSKRLHGSNLGAMDRSASPLDPPAGVRRTKTGRVSKAVKGQRVHHCEDCGKTYTRAEHLRRHSRSHTPGDFQCDSPDCDRAFHRDDLLARQQARHDDPLDPPSRRPSQASKCSPGHVSSIRPRSAQRESGTFVSRSPVPLDDQSGSSQLLNGARIVERRQSHKRHIRVSDLRAHMQSTSVDTAQPHFSTFHDTSYAEQTSQYDSSDDGFVHANAQFTYMPFAQQHFGDGHLSGDANFCSLQSPMTTTSSGEPHWGIAVSPDSRYCAPSADPSFQTLPMSYHPLWTDPHFTHQALFDSKLRDDMEAPKLATPPVMIKSMDTTGIDLEMSSDEQRYLDAYWFTIHPAWPIMHRRSFDATLASPLQRAAMIALGAQSTGERDAFSTASKLHERCVKVITQRTIEASHTYRTCDMQAILLVEIFAIYMSRRPPLQLTQPLQVVLDVLMNEANPERALMGDAFVSTVSSYDAGDLGMGFEQRCRHRMLAACYILDRQHAVLFGRPRILALDQLAPKIPFPCPRAVWDTVAGHASDTLLHFGQSTLYDIANTGANTGAIVDDDMFQLQLLMAYMSDLGNHERNTSESKGPIKGIKPIFEQSLRASLLYHTTMLCHHAHVRDLLAVAGESWVMAAKMSSQTEYTAAQIDTRQWATDSHDELAPIHLALTHALEILRISQQFPRTGLLFQAWSIYLASLVIWSRAYVASPPRRKLRLSIPSPVEPHASAHELERAVTAVIEGGPTAPLTWQEAKSVLLWTKSNIEGIATPAQTCGLTNGALDVLGKLVRRGSEEGHWF